MSLPERNHAALVCTHVARQSLPILRARRDVAIEESDSGWQFLCASGAAESEITVQLWSLGEVLKRDPSVSAIADAEPGAVYTRTRPGAPWIRSR